MPQQIQLSPEQVPQFLEQTKAELASLQTVIDEKNQVLALLNQMDVFLGAGDHVSALTCFTKIQRLEYELTVKSLLEKKSQGEAIIKQLESQSLVTPAHVMPSKMPPFGGGKRN